MNKISKKAVKNTPKRPLRTSQRVAILLGVVVFLLVGILSGILPYAAAYVGCLKAPVVASTFAASYSYTLPGEFGYGPVPFASSYYCSQAEAEKAGFQHSPLTEGGRAELAQQATKEASNKGSLDFTMYIPTNADYSLKYVDVVYADGKLFPSAFVSANVYKKNDAIGRMMVQNIGNERALCDPNYYQCAVIGVDSKGREVKKVTESKNNVGSRYQLGVQIGNTSVVIFSDAELNEQDIINFFGSLQPDSRPPSEW
jgi:hypothetical protein